MEIEFLDSLEEAEYLDHEMDDNEDSNVCRVCLRENPSLLVSIAVKHKTCKNIAGLIKYVAGVQVLESDLLPQYICKECYDQLEDAYKIKKKCVASDKQMRDQINNIQIKEEAAEESIEAAPIELQEIEEVDYDDTIYEMEMLGSDEEYKPPPSVKRSIANSIQLPKVPAVPKKKQQLKGPTNCKNCGKQISTMIGLKRHYAECSETFQLCEICNTRFQGKAIFKKHIAEHEKNGDQPILECVSCSAKFYCRDDIGKHKCDGSVHISDKIKNLCYLCNEEFDVQKQLFIHITKTHRRDGLFYCPVEDCEAKTVYTPKTFHYHLESHFECLNIVCKICGEIFNDRYLFYVHDLEHKNGIVYKCDHCGKEILNKESLLKHIQLMHISTPNYPCDSCGCSFRTEPQLKKHQIKEHGAIGNFQCNLCGTWFLQQQSLRYHMKSHIAKEMVPCQLCTQQFKHNLDLKRHIELAHMRETPYRCDVCLKYFMRGYDLTCHKRLHTGDKRHGCSVCGMRFYTKSALVTHIRVHTGETPYTCYLCDKKYKDHRGVRSHLKKFHKIENPNTKNMMNKAPFQTTIEVIDNVVVGNYIEIKDEEGKNF